MEIKLKLKGRSSWARLIIKTDGPARDEGEGKQYIRKCTVPSPNEKSLRGAQAITRPYPTCNWALIGDETSSSGLE